MSRRRLVWFGCLAIIVAVIIWGITRKSAPPQIPFTHTTRQTIVSTLSTNGKVEPIEWASARAERAGVIQKVYVTRGQHVDKGAPLVQLDATSAASTLATAESQITQARAQEQTLSQGGNAAERALLESDMGKARLDLQAAQRELASAERLYAKQAGTKEEVDSARERVQQAQTAIASIEKRRAALVTTQEQSVARAHLSEAQAAASSARRDLSLGIVRAPVAGIVYQFDQRVGAFVNPGDLIANIGKLSEVRVIVYVDEPDLGRVAIGMPVTITWDALPGRSWKGEVDKVPTQVITLNTRQVGEVGCVIDNPDRDLLPGTNIDAEIVSKVVPDAIVIPKETLRRENGQTGVYALTADNHIEWRTITTGVSNLTRVQVTKGLAVGDAVMLPNDRPIKNGQKVDPVYP